MQAFILFACLSSLLQSSVVGEGLIKFENVVRDIYLNSDKINVEYEILVKNIDEKHCMSINFVVKESIAQKLFHINAKNSDLNLLNITKKHSAKIPSTYRSYSLLLTEAIQPGDTAKVYVNLIFGGRFNAYPNTTAQKSDHFFIFYDDFYIDSAYEVENQLTNIHINKNNLISYSNDQNSKVTTGYISLGPYKDISPFSSKPFFVHFKYDNPIFTIDLMVRNFQISEWGHISVKEEMWVHNDASTLSGPYSKYKDSMSDPHAIYHWEMLLPPSAYNIMYRDELGNISTSKVDMSRSNKRLTLIPRFPLYGGWKTYYYVSYDLPPDSFLYKIDHSHNRKFSFDLLGSPSVEFLASEVFVRVALPEHSRIQSYKYDKFIVDRIEVSKTHSYLDFYGRPTIEFMLFNGCSEKETTIEITYQYEDIYIWHKPLLVSTGVFFLFILFRAIIFIRYPVLYDSKSKYTEDKERLCSHIQSLVNKVSSSHKACMLKISEFKLNKDSDKLNSFFQNICQKMDDLIAQISKELETTPTLQSTLSKATSEKIVASLNQKRKLLDDYHKASLSVVDGSMTREEYSKESKKVEELMAKSDNSIYEGISAL